MKINFWTAFCYGHWDVTMGEDGIPSSGNRLLLLALIARPGEEWQDSYDALTITRRDRVRLRDQYGKTTTDPWLSKSRRAMTRAEREALRETFRQAILAEKERLEKELPSPWTCGDHDRYATVKWLLGQI